MRVVAIAGGTGSAKLLRGFSQLRIDLTVIANVGDNFWVHGLYVCPDVDIAMYTLAGIADPARGWGIDGDTYATLSQLKRLGRATWFSLGDKDFATSVVRTNLLETGATLTKATKALCRALGVKQGIIPVTDDDLQTYIKTPSGILHLQEFWVRERGRPAVLGVIYRGASKARVSKETASIVEGADRIVLCPANPVTSIGPILAVPGFMELLKRTNARVTALSPMRGVAPYSGPAAKLMKARGVRADSAGIAAGYSPFLDAMLVDRADAPMVEEIRQTGVGCKTTNGFLGSPEDEKRLAGELLAV